MSKIVGVYGTLKKGKYNAHLLENEKFIKNDFINGKLYAERISGLYPMLVLDKKGKEIDVEVYEISDKVFSGLKGMEERHGYKTVDVKLKSGDSVIMWVYEKINRLFWKPVDKF